MAGGGAGLHGRQNFMIGAIVALLDGIGHVAVGSTSPIPATAALLARRRNPALRVSLLGSERHNVFTDGNRELFDCAAQGRIDAFFLSGGQIDGGGRINLVGTGSYPETETRFPGSFGSAFLYPLIPRIILFREAHSRRTLVERVDFVSAGPGTTGDRNEGPYALVTGRAVFRFRPETARFALTVLATGETCRSVADNTGFQFDDDLVGPDHGKALSSEGDAEIDDVVATELAEDYPAFARTRLGGAPVRQQARSCSSPSDLP